MVAIEGAPDDVRSAFTLMWETIAANRAEKSDSAKQGYRSSRSVSSEAEATRQPRTPTRERDATNNNNNGNSNEYESVLCVCLGMCRCVNVLRRGAPATPGSGSAIPR